MTVIRPRPSPLALGRGAVASATEAEVKSWRAGRRYGTLRRYNRRSVRLNTRKLDHFGPLLGFVGYKLAEVGG
jgi:hypothetical protein